MKIARILLTGLICLSMMLSFAACDGSKESKPVDPKTSLTSDQQNVIDQTASSLPKIELENKDVIWLAWWELAEEDAEVALFKSAYDGNIINRFTNWENRYTTLSAQVMGGDAPDIFPFESDNFPTGIISQMYAPIDDIIDIEDDVWADTREIMEQYKWGDHYYCVVPYTYEGDLLVYNREVLEAHGLDDPYDLYVQNKWDWKAFKTMLLDFVDKDEERFGLGGWNPEYAFISTTGVPMIGSKDGKLVNNLKAPEVQKAQKFLGELNDEGLNYPFEEFNWSDNLPFIGDGKMLFYATGSWQVKDDFCNPLKQDLGDKIFFVPFPKDPDADKYYQDVTNGADVHMLIKGAPNPEGVAAWQNVRRVAKYDKEADAVGRQKMIDDYNMSEEMLDFLDELRAPGTFAPVFDFRKGLGTEITKDNGPIENTIHGPFRAGTSYIELVEENNDAIDYALNDINKSAN